MSVFDRRRADELAAALDRAAGSTGSGSLAGSAPVALAERLRAAGTALETVVAPRAEFRAALRTRLVAVATVQPVTVRPVTAAPAAARSWREARLQRGAAVAAGALASVVAVSGVAVASSEALPGDPFYGVKRAAEDVQLRLAGDATAEGTRHLQFAATRLDELTALTLGRDGAGATTDWDLVRQTLADMDSETVAGTRLLETAWRERGDRTALDTLTGFAAEQAAGLQALMPVLGPTVLDAAESSLVLVSQVRADVELLTGGVCGPACTRGTTPGGAADPSCDCPTAPPAAPATEQPSLAPSLPGAPAIGSPEPSAGSPSADPSSSPSTSPSPSPSPSPSTDAPAPLTPVPTVPAPSPLGSPLPSSAVTSRLPALDPSLPALSPGVTSPDAGAGSAVPDLPTG